MIDVLVNNCSEQYVYKKEADWSLLTEGLTIRQENQMVFGKIANRLLQPGETKDIVLYLNGISYNAKIRNLKLNPKWNRAMMQIRYSKNGDLAQALQGCFMRTYEYLKHMRDLREMGDRSTIKIPDGEKEYLAIYTTEYDDSYVLDTINREDIDEFRAALKGYSERMIESDQIFELIDATAGINQKKRFLKLRKLNKKIGDNLKILYGYRCQICGKMIGEQYGSHVVEAHHIDYFIKSLNNDASNQMIVCPNHHSIIHDAEPVFDRKKLLYRYSNGYEEKLMLNKHL